MYVCMYACIYLIIYLYVIFIYNKSLDVCLSQNCFYGELNE